MSAEGLEEYETASIHKFCVHYLNDIGLVVSRGYLIVNNRTHIHDKPVGLIEDIWTHEDYRKQGLASIVTQSLINIAKREGCYKIVLSCADENVSFYTKLGFAKHQNAMRLSLR